MVGTGFVVAVAGVNTGARWGNRRGCKAPRRWSPSTQSPQTAPAPPGIEAGSRCLRMGGKSALPQHREHDTPVHRKILSQQWIAPLLAAVATALATTILLPSPSLALTASSTDLAQRPPYMPESDKERCALRSSAIGQADAARDQVIDARQCDLRNRDFTGYDISGAYLEGAKADGSRFDRAMMSKALAEHLSCRDCSFVDAVVDRVNFDGADLSGSVFTNAVLSDAIFTDQTQVQNADFSDVYIGSFAQRRLCRNPTLQGTNPSTGVPTRASLGCPEAP